MQKNKPPAKGLAAKSLKFIGDFINLIDVTFFYTSTYIV